MKKYISLLLTTLILLTSTLPISAASGIEIFDAAYDYIRPFDGDFASVYRDGEYAIIRKDNAVFYTSDADGFGNYREGMISFYENGSTKIAQLNGDTLALPGIQFAGDFYGGKCIVVNAQKQYGLIDTQGRYILECQYEDILCHESDTILVKQNGVWQILSLTSEAKIPYMLADPVFSETGEHIIASNGTGYALLSTEPPLLTDFKYDLIQDIGDDRFAAYHGDYADLLGTDGTILFTVKADYIGACSEGILPCHDANGFRYINLFGNTVLLPQIEGLSQMDAFYDSYAVVKVSSGYTYMNAAGQQAVRNVWDYADRFAGGYALVMNYRLDEDTKTMEQQWYIIDTGFNVVTTLEDDVYYSPANPASANFSQGYVLTMNREENKMGFIRLQTEEDIPTTGFTVRGSVTSFGENPTDAILVELIPERAVEAKYSDIVYGNETEYVIDNVAPGIYTLRVSKPKHVTREYTITVGNP